MLFTRTTYIGIDPTAGVKPFTYAALDGDLRLLALGEGGLEDILAFLAGQRQAAAGVCAPRRPNQGLMTQREFRLALDPPPASGRWLDFRLADYQLRRHNISAPQIPSNPEACPNWMRMGFQLFRRMDALGYTAAPAPGSDEPAVERISVEVYPFAAYTAMLGVLPFPKLTLEGRLQRQLALHARNVRLPDPMDFFEEITRHRLMKGILPTDRLHSPAELDALAAAYTAYLLVNRPEETCRVGDPAEGEILLPVPALEPRYREAG
jgi:hypothetical protein